MPGASPSIFAKSIFGATFTSPIVSLSFHPRRCHTLDVVILSNAKNPRISLRRCSFLIRVHPCKSVVVSHLPARSKKARSRVARQRAFWNPCELFAILPHRTQPPTRSAHGDGGVRGAASKCSSPVRLPSTDCLCQRGPASPTLQVVPPAHARSVAAANSPTAAPRGR